MRVTKGSFSSTSTREEFLFWKVHLDIIIDGPQRLECAVVMEKEFGNAECGMPSTSLHRLWTYGVLRNRGKLIVLVEEVGCDGGGGKGNEWLEAW